jgi:tetratricopeptide (TPR) repeat protein
LCRGYLHESQGNGVMALAEYDATLPDLARMANPHWYAKALSLRGGLRAEQGRYADAIDDLKQAYDLQSRAGERAAQRYTLGAIANLYADPNVADYTQALAYYRQQLAVPGSTVFGKDQAGVLFNIGSTLQKQGQHAAALTYLNQALSLDRQWGGPADVAYDERAVAVVLARLGRLDDALRRFDDAIALYRKANASDSAALAANLADVRLSRAIALRQAGKFAAALPDAEAAAAYYGKSESLRLRETAQDEFAASLAGLEEWQRAYAARTEHLATLRTLQRQLLDEKTTRLKVQFQTERQTLQNEVLSRENAAQQAELRAEHRTQRWQWLALALSIVTITLLTVLVMRQVSARRRMHDLAMTDELTRLPNRRHFMALADSALVQRIRDRTPLTVAAIDIDHFKRVNDTWGHAAGDFGTATHGPRPAQRLAPRR